MHNPSRTSLIVQVMSIIVTFVALLTCIYLLFFQPEGLPGNIANWAMGLFSLTVGSWLPRRRFDRL
jgi:ABC-type multidrug transport system permease subunit